jgi:hypothetical protein
MSDASPEAASERRELPTMFDACTPRSYVRFNELRYDNAETDINESEDLLERCIVLNKGSPSIDRTVPALWD